ncbi:MAG: response regulator [Eubacterium sp.]|nr:response regulator [Eubacterium sp.]
MIPKEKVRLMKDWDEQEGENNEITIFSTLPQNITDNEYLYFDTRRDVTVYINGELRKDFIENRDVNMPGGVFRRFYVMVPLKREDSGSQIIIVRHSVADIDREVPEVFIGTPSASFVYLFNKMGHVFVLSFIVLIFSFVSFVVSIVLRLMFRTKIDMMYGALSIFVIAAWLITDSMLFPFVFGVYHVNGLISFMLCLTIPLPLIEYLTSIQRGRYGKSMSIIMIVSIINVIIWPLLHFTGIVPYYNMIDLANAVLVFLAIAGLAVLIIDAVRGNTVSYHYTFIGFIGFLVGCLIELTCVILEVSFVKEYIFMVVGLAFLLTFIVIQQVHDLRMINKEKQHAIDISEAKTRFLASMSHEIRTPINAILGMNEMILRENNDKAVEEYSRNIKTSGNMLLMLVNDVLDFTKIESGKMEIKDSDFLMSDMLYDVISLINERVEEKNLELKVEIGEDVPNKLISDEFRIRQIIINLLNNAVKYTEKGSVTLRVDGESLEDKYSLSLLVKDTGKGIRKEDQEFLFDAFSRADIKTNANIEGTGLGLAIVKSIVDSMNGEVGVESEYGSGSKFWVNLPVRFEEGEILEKDFMEKKVEQTAVTPSSSFAAPDAKILAVDDNQSNLTIVKLFLKRNGIVPDLCSSGEKAIELCKEKKYDLILMDHMMPEPDGIEALHIIRKDEASVNKETKIIVLTANAVAGSRKMYLEEGFDEYLTKPIDSNVLEELVKNMLPQEKVIEAVAATSAEDTGTLKNRLSSIEGLDYDEALGYCGGEEEMLLEIIGDIAREWPERSERMRKSLEEKDIKAYKIDAHSIKSSMATIGLKEFSERAKKHEFAARDNDIAFIYGEADSFINEYIDICKKLGERSSSL